MIKKERKKPVKIKVLQAMLVRLPPTHATRPYIETELGKAVAGWRGEQAVDYFLSFYQSKSMSFLKIFDCKKVKIDFFNLIQFFSLSTFM